MKKIVIEDKKILKLLEDKAEISKKQLAISNQFTKLETEFNKNLALHARIDEKARPLINVIVSKLVLGEFEELSRVHQTDDKKWIIEISDRMDEFKHAWKHRKDPKPKDIITTS